MSPTDTGDSSSARAGVESADGRYRFVRQLGRGGMGEVWLAQDTAVDREVAVKLPNPGDGQFDPSSWLAAEAQTVARLNHPNLVALLDRTRVPLDSSEEARTALVFEYVSGRPLSLWADRPRPWRWLRGIVRQILEALAYAHGRGLVHRDLKPSNILLSGDPLEPKVNLLDFGIAAWSAPSRAVDELPTYSKLTPLSTSAPGTRAYMAPEQAELQSGDVGPWTDLYSLGVVISELLLGRLPFPGDSPELIWTSRARVRFSPPAQALADLGVPLRRFLLRMLAPDPAQRFGWAADALRILPGSMIPDLTTGLHEATLSPESTDVMMELVPRAEDRDTDPDPNPAPLVREGIEGASITLELTPAENVEVQLPPSWAVDRPSPEAWASGLERPLFKSAGDAPAVSYSLLSMRDAPLQGREELWKEAWSHLATVAETQRPALLMLEGPQGRGKTRFARELAAVAEEVGVARSHHVRFRGDGSGAGALRRLLHRILRVAELDEVHRPERVRRVLAEAGYPPEADLVPRLIAMLTPGQHRRGPELEEPTTALELFRVLGRRRPLILWLEDIDRAKDRALVTWLRQLFRAEGDLPVAVIATCRDDEVDSETREPAWVMLRSRPETKILRMEPLADAAIAGILGFTAGTSEDLGLEIARWSRGDPRGAQQIARHLHESGRLRWSPGGFELRGDTPSTAGHLKLDSILRARARDAEQAADDEEATRAVLDLLSLVRERARHEYLVLAADRIGVNRRRIEEAIGPLVLAALVDVRDEGTRLVHTALAEAVREGMELRRQTDLHKAWAVVREASGRGHGRAERLLEAAWNRAACGQDDLAARDELEAAHLLRGRWEIKAAWRAIQSASGRVGTRSDLIEPREYADLQILSVVLEHEVRTPPGTPSDLAMELDMLQPMWVSLTPSVERCRGDLVHAEALRAAGRPGDAREALTRGLEGARDVGSKLWECRALVQLADSVRLEGELTEADELGGRAMALASDIGEEQLMLSVLVVRLPVAIALADVERAKLWLDKLRGLLRSRASWQDLQNLWLFRGEVERVAGRREAAQQAYQTALNLGRERGLANAGILLKLASLALEVGELQRARSSLDELSSVDSASSVHSHELRSTRSILQVELAARLGDADAAGGALQDAEILQSQAALALPQLLESLRRVGEASELPLEIRQRAGSLAGRMAARLSTGTRRRRG